MVPVIGRERRARVWEYVVGETEMRMWVVGLDAAGERPRYGTRFRISPCGTWKARTRSGPCDAKTTKEQTAWSASSTAAIERERDARCGSVGFPPLSRNATDKLGLHN